MTVVAANVFTRTRNELVFSLLYLFLLLKLTDAENSKS